MQTTQMWKKKLKVVRTLSTWSPRPDFNNSTLRPSWHRRMHSTTMQMASLHKCKSIIACNRQNSWAGTRTSFLRRCLRSRRGTRLCQICWDIPLLSLISANTYCPQWCTCLHLLRRQSSPCQTCNRRTWNRGRLSLQQWTRRPSNIIRTLPHFSNCQTIDKSRCA